MHTGKSDHHIISHDPSTVRVEQTQTNLPKPKIPVVVLSALGILLITVGAVWYSNGQSFDFRKRVDEEFVIEPIDDAVIATVGAENIYGEDLKYKKSLVPKAILTTEMESELLNRLIDESIILQAGAEADYVELNETVFNSAIKNKQERQKMITQVTEAVNQNAAHKKGAFISIWFMNTVPGPIGYEEGKKVALAKITELHEQVENGTLTIKQAGDQVKNDASLQQLDPSYKANAYAEFDTRTSPQITFDDAFTQKLLALDSGEISEVTLIKDYENSDLSQPKKDAVYMFGQVTEVQSDGNVPFEEWLTTQRSNYEIIKN